MVEDRCLIHVVDIALGPVVAENVASVIGAAQPSMHLAEFDWERKGKSKRARGSGDEPAPVASSSSAK